MTAARHVSLPAKEADLASFWLPPRTEGNGLDATSWAELIVVDQRRATELLAALGAAGIAARMRARPSGREDGEDIHVWVDPARYGDAENVLIKFGNEMTGR